MRLLELRKNLCHTWMEDLIKKWQEKKGKSLLPSLQPEEDEFEEIYWFLRKPRLRREDCPNPIPWWGVSDDLSGICVSKALY